jgi:hypothetical protein
MKSKYFIVKRPAYSILFYIILINLTGCKKLIEINEPIDSITTKETFKDSSNTASAFAGLYSVMVNGLSTECGALSIYAGESADEIVPYITADDQVFANDLQADNSPVRDYFWTTAFKVIYQANSIIEGVTESKGMSPGVKSRFISEAKFIRALIYFHVINLFGDMPYLTSSDYKINSTASRLSKSEIYKSIVEDLLEGQTTLRDDYSLSAGEKIRPNKWAATALLARVYLFKEEWANAEQQATSLINNATFELDSDLNNVFLKNNPEAILQWQIYTAEPPYDATPEGFAFVPKISGQPNYYLSEQLVQAFEPGDARKMYWANITVLDGDTLYYPYKYKIGEVQATPGASPTEYTMVLRLAEQYLIRAEARTRSMNLSGAIADINMIRNRAGLPNLLDTLSQEQLLNAILQERRVELFAECGNRWLDMKRLTIIDEIMSTATPLKGQGTSWKSYQQLYPIPFSELQNDPNLKQNPGY